MVARSTPEDGDIVVLQDTRDVKPVFVLLTAFGPDQFTYQTGDAALAKALIVAERQRVRVWLTDGDDDFTLVEDFRVPASV